MNPPLLTVYITNYNYGQYIQQAIESVLTQNFQDFELLIIDDGSTDNSSLVIESYANNPKIKVIYQQNKGLNITNNIALSLSKAKYIMRLDADDYLAPDALEKMLNVLKNDSEVGMIFPNYFLVDKDGKQIGEVKRHDFTKNVELYDQPAHGACTIINTEYLKSVGGYDESYTCQDGYELWIKFISKYKVRNIQESLFYYRQHGKNLTTNEDKILNTRRNINLEFIKNNKLITPKTIALIPLRNTSMKGEWLIKQKIGNRYLLDFKLDQLFESKNIESIILTSHDKEIIDFLQKRYKHKSKINIIERPEELARHNVSLYKTCLWIAGQYPEEIEAIVILPLEFPFVEGHVVDDAINSMTIFGSDALISVRKEKTTIFQHNGSGMHPILNHGSFTRLEREALYKNVGGVLLSKISTMKKYGKLLDGKVGHIIVNQKTAHSIQTKFDLQLANFMLEV